MGDSLIETTDKDRAALIWLLTGIKPELEQIERGSMLFQFPDSDEVLSVAGAYDEDLELLIRPRKLQLIGELLNAQVIIFLAGSRAGGRNG